MDFAGDNISTPPVEEEIIESTEVSEEAAPEQTPDPQAELFEKVKGLETAIGREREERRILEAKAQYLEQLAFQKAAGVEPADDFDPDDFPTNERVKQMVSKEVNQIKESVRQQQILSMEEAAKAQWSDFDEVVGTYTKEMVSADPDLYNVIMSAKNPAQMAYKIGRTHEKYEEKIKKSTAQNIAKKIDSNLNQTPTLSSLGGVSNDRVQSGHYSRMPKQDFEKLVAEVLSKP